MTRKRPALPTDRELDLLQILWHLGKSSVRDIHEALLKTEQTSFTTVQTMLQVMFSKGLVERELIRRSFFYWPAETEVQTQTSMVAALMERAFGGSAKTLMSRALDARTASPAELDEIQELIKTAREAHND